MSIPEDVKEIVDESGNSFHCRVTNFLKEKGWHTLISPYYMDGATNKPREIDLIAEKHWSGKRDYGRGSSGAITVKLFIECKYVPQPTVFWFSNKDMTAATKWVMSNTPLKSEDNKYTRQHHYLASEEKAAKLFASKNKQSTETEPIYRALNQSLNAMVYLRKQQSIIPEIRDGIIPRLASVEMPVILCNSFANFYRVEMDDQTTPQPVKENFQLEVNYAYQDLQGNHRSEYFLLNVINFEKFADYLTILESDKDAMFHFL
ncbi:MAG TPA: hypothetical protein VGW77_35925 [Candidatus Binatia bacterium]|jgi:hypothetical protein|nr:hypothetical protein [Candidatus Binatia bacterium]